ncbi:DUF1707 domain-containing protein [Streptomyces sp. YU58]|uniref:DUF1707 SHOCT-like domain-containing protein n=1 Tax=Streptomyces sp. SX92 TaxID=3158972 RepID=UPI0027B9EC8F|nr:DUF1707 domain-containing protein [Streptomyces coralus]WLW55526.1 DUF1707 domain-containing protein [Streptomyces coralus]
MNEPRDAQLRISHDDRDHALEALTEHSREGRLTIDEYGDRVTAPNEARTRADLLALFDDLPEPRPSFTEAPPTTAPGATRTPAAATAPGATVAVPPEPGSALPEPHRPQTVRQRLTRLSVPVGAVTSVGLT